MKDTFEFLYTEDHRIKVFINDCDSEIYLENYSEEKLESKGKYFCTNQEILVQKGTSYDPVTFEKYPSEIHYKNFEKKGKWVYYENGKEKNIEVH